MSSDYGIKIPSEFLAEETTMPGMHMGMSSFSRSTAHKALIQLFIHLYIHLVNFSE